MNDAGEQTLLEYATPIRRRYSRLAIGSLACVGISAVSLLVLFSATTSMPLPAAVDIAILLMPVGALASLVLGIGALEHPLSKRSKRYCGKWMALVGVVYGGLFVLVCVVLFLAYLNSR